MPNPAIPEARYLEFFAHPCWQAFRQTVASRLDSAADVVFKSGDIDEINRARGVMHGLMFVLDTEDNLRNIISDQAEALDASPSIERCIREILKLMETE